MPILMPMAIQMPILFVMAIMIPLLFLKARTIQTLIPSAILIPLLILMEIFILILIYLPLAKLIPDAEIAGSQTYLSEAMMQLGKALVTTAALWRFWQQHRGGQLHYKVVNISRNLRCNNLANGSSFCECMQIKIQMQIHL